MMWTSGTFEPLVIGWLIWFSWVLSAALFWNLTIPGTWDRVPQPLRPFERAARRRNAFVSSLGLSAVAQETAVVLEARDRWLAWRYLGVWFPGLLTSFLPLTLMMFSTPDTDGGPRTSVLERLPAAVALTGIAVLPLAMTVLAYGLSATRTSPTWWSDAEVWRRLRYVLLDAHSSTQGSTWRSTSQRSARSLRSLAAALERDFMRMDDIVDPARLGHARRAAIGAVLDHRGWVTRRPNRKIDKKLATRFADQWLTGNWDKLHQGRVRSRAASGQPGARTERRGVTIAAVVLYVALGAAVMLGGYSDWEARVAVIIALLVPLLAPLTLTLLEVRGRPPAPDS